MDEWKLIYTTNTAIEAEMLAENLHGAGIEAQVESQIDSAFSLTVGDLAVAKVFVQKKDEEDALAILNDILKSNNEG